MQIELWAIDLPNQEIQAPYFGPQTLQPSFLGRVLAHDQCDRYGEGWSECNCIKGFNFLRSLLFELFVFPIKLLSLSFFSLFSFIGTLSGQSYCWREWWRWHGRHYIQLYVTPRGNILFLKIIPHHPGGVA